jgi:hypothetical protein
VDRSRPFQQRHVVYLRLDEQLGSRTRFFAAAALTNAVFARLFQLVPGHSLSHVYHFLADAGTILEAANLQFARELPQRSGNGVALDQYLVCSEQRRLQTLLNTSMAHADSHWRSTRRDLNHLLNEQPLLALGASCSASSRHYYWALQKVREHLGAPLDFANETHRINIGLGIIRHIRSGGCPVV